MLNRLERHEIRGHLWFISLRSVDKVSNLNFQFTHAFLANFLFEHGHIVISVLDTISKEERSFRYFSVKQEKIAF